MSRPAPGRPLFALFWRLYILLGVVSVLAGAYLLGWQRHAPDAPNSLLTPIQLVGVVLVAFGVIRIGNAVYQIWRIYRGAPRPR